MSQSLTINLTVEDLTQIIPDLSRAKAARLLVPLINACGEYDINTPKRVAVFLAQIAHESGGFQFFQEIWGPTEAQKRYEPPSDLAKRLGNTEPGDGKRFKGRGAIQLTGRANYATYGEKLGLDLIRKPDLAAEPVNAFRIAGLYWKDHGCNTLADADCFRQITWKINGGLNGLDSRKSYWSRAKTVLGMEAADGQTI